MTKIEIDEMKKIQLNILIDVAKFCEENNIKYFLSYGTLIGAIRHKGFIPWDDDIDISMPRPDYERFIKEYKSENYNVFCWTPNNKILYAFGKVYDNRTILKENGDFGEEIGINIDIFPLDGVPKNKIKFKLFKLNINALWAMNVAAIINDYSKRRRKNRIAISILKLFYRIFPLQHFFTGVFIKKIKKYKLDNTQYMGVGRMEDIMPKEYAYDLIKKEFENRHFYVPKKYDEYLRNIYGDYMKLPPKEERVYKHNAKAYWKD